MSVNIALLTVTDTRTLKNDKSGGILVKKIKKAKHNLVDRKICKDSKATIKKILKQIGKRFFFSPIFPFLYVFTYCISTTRVMRHNIISFISDSRIVI